MDQTTDLWADWKNRPSQTGPSIFRKSGFFTPADFADNSIGSLVSVFASY